MQMRYIITAAILVLLVLMFGTAVAAEPTMTVSVSAADTETEVSEGQEVMVSSDPVGISIDAAADEPIESLFVRVDGETQRSFSPNSESMSKTVYLDVEDSLTTGENTITIIADASSTRSFSFTVIKDNRRPSVSYTSPFSTDTSFPPDQFTVSNAKVTISGDLKNISPIEFIRIESTYEYEFAGRTRTFESQTQIDDPGDSFSDDIFLGHGENDVEIKVRDEMGNVRQHETTITMVDNAQPQLDISVPSTTYEPSVTLSGTVSDNHQLDEVEIRYPEGGSASVLTKSTQGPDPERQSVEIDETISLQGGNNEFYIIATDVAGHESSQSFSVTYDDSVDPIIKIDTERTIVQDGEVNVYGRVFAGEITSVSVETVDPSTDSILDISQVYAGDEPASEINVSETLDGDEDSIVRIRAIDTDGAEQVESYRIGSSASNEEGDNGSEGADDEESTPDNDNGKETTESGEPVVTNETGDGFGIGLAVSALTLFVVAMYVSRLD